MRRLLKAAVRSRPALVVHIAIGSTRFGAGGGDGPRRSRVLEHSGAHALPGKPSFQAIADFVAAAVVP